ncbi:MAG: membrane protein insertase YidC [Gemmataceae bacterium]|nr:membrane protein insertase YidC [Gemmataceae bacterium]
MKSNKNFLLFFTASFILFAAWMEIKRALWPPPAPKKNLVEAVEKKIDDGPLKGKAMDAPTLPNLPANQALLSMGSKDASSPYHLGVEVDPVGACIRQVYLNKFQQSNRLGLPIWADPAKKTPQPLNLMPLERRWSAGANFLFLFDPKDHLSSQPADTLGNASWKVVEGPVELKTPHGKNVQRISFQTKAGNVLVTKTFTLAPNEYHLGLELSFLNEGSETLPSFRYQLTAGRDLPIEGDWFTNTFRNALIAQVDDKRNVYRELQDARQMAHWQGGSEVLANQSNGLWFRYAGIAVQYFASVVAIDDDQIDQKFIQSVRPTLEAGYARGVIARVDTEAKALVLRGPNGGESPYWFASKQEMDEVPFPLVPGRQVAVYYRHVPSSEKTPIHVVVGVKPDNLAQPLFENDYTVRLNSRPVLLTAGKTVSHKFLLYNGPVKPSLLGDFSGNSAVNPDTLEKYVSRLGLNTLTDYQSPGWIGSFCSSIFWTDLVIKCTNLMHWVLWKLYLVIPNFGLVIIFLTILVRGMMFPLSKKQAVMSIKMQELAPELKKIQEKFRGDRQGLGVAQMELYRKHNVNPLGTCWVILIQMPVFMGLYFALQESIHFRLAIFWPLWMPNLAAPDMLINWGESIPFLSRPEDYGGFLYLGPYFNIMPICAIFLMVVQQKMFTPPPTDEQQETQQKMMTYMMIFMGFMFYKVAAGLCIYFIASSLWGLAERKLLPKKHGSNPAFAGAGDVAIKKDLALPIKNSRNGKKEATGTNPAEKSTLAKLKGWWQEIQRKAEKK